MFVILLFVVFDSDTITMMVKFHILTFLLVVVVFASPSSLCPSTSGNLIMLCSMDQNSYILVLFTLASLSLLVASLLSFFQLPFTSLSPSSAPFTHSPVRLPAPDIEHLTEVLSIQLQ